jgi:hypothetical protein
MTPFVIADARSAQGPESSGVQTVDARPKAGMKTSGAPSIRTLSRPTILFLRRTSACEAAVQRRDLVEGEITRGVAFE